MPHTDTLITRIPTPDATVTNSPELCFHGFQNDSGDAEIKFKFILKFTGVEIMNNDSCENRYRELIDVIGEINSVIRVGRFHFLDCFGFLALKVKR